MSTMVLQKATVLVFAGVSARVRLLVSVVASFEHVRLVDVPADINVFVAHDLCEVVPL